MLQLHDSSRLSFASDNLAGVHPEVFEAMAAAGEGHTPAYGEDPYTLRFEQVCTEIFGPGTRSFPVLNGTGANVLALAAATPGWGAVVTPASSHLVTDEAGAPEHAAGLKLLTYACDDGKLRPEQIESAAADLGNQHHAQATTVSIANVTEVGTVYTPDEVAELAEAAHRHGMLVHLDGSRLANAAAYLGVSLAALTSHAGVDVLSLGATKNGAMLAEAVVVLPGEDARLAHAVGMSRKGQLQLVSKLRFVSAQLLAMYDGDLWRRNAAQANEMASLLADGLVAAGCGYAQPVESNMVFALLPGKDVERLRARFDFHGDGTEASPARLVCAFDTPLSFVEDFLAALEA